MSSHSFLIVVSCAVPVLYGHLLNLNTFFQRGGTTGSHLRVASIGHGSCEIPATTMANGPSADPDDRTSPCYTNTTTTAATTPGATAMRMVMMMMATITYTTATATDKIFTTIGGATGTCHFRISRADQVHRDDIAIQATATMVVEMMPVVTGTTTVVVVVVVVVAIYKDRRQRGSRLGGRRRGRRSG